MSTQIQTNKIGEFFDLVSQGVSAFVRAGTLLCEIMKEDPDALREISRLNPMLNWDVLNSFLAIGERTLYPYLLLDTSAGAMALCELPYEQQEKLYTSGVPVLEDAGPRAKEVIKPVGKLSHSEVRMVFDNDKIRTIPEQREFLVTLRVPAPSPKITPPSKRIIPHGRSGHGALNSVSEDKTESAKRGLLLNRAWASVDSIKHIKTLMGELLPDHSSIAQFDKMLAFLSKFGDFIQGLNTQIKAADADAKKAEAADDKDKLIEGDFAPPLTRNVTDANGRPQTLTVLRAIEKSPQTLHQIADATGLTVHEVDNSLSALRNRMQAKIISGQGANRLIGITKPGEDAIVYHNRIMAQKERRNQAV